MIWLWSIGALDKLKEDLGFKVENKKTKASKTRG